VFIESQGHQSRFCNLDYLLLTDRSLGVFQGKQLNEISSKFPNTKMALTVLLKALTTGSSLAIFEDLWTIEQKQ
jgi:hypothetical protein